MWTRRLVVGGAAVLALLISQYISGPAVAQGGAALTGVVSSQEEGKMEGVVVTARRDGANFDVSVVSDAQGKYSFPRTHLQPGKYSVKIRALGYGLTSPAAVEVGTGKAASLDLTLAKTQDLSSQITSVDWLMNVAGTEEQKGMIVKPLLSCIYCHSVERIVKSKYTADQFVAVINRMQKYYPDGSMAGTEGRGRAQFNTKEAQANAEKNPNWGGFKKTDIANYLASINASGGRSLPVITKTLPRPKGKETRVIITQYDMPRKDTVPHDMDVDAKGTPWYTDQSRPFLGKMDPKTAVFTEYPLPPVKMHEFAGGSDVHVDKDDNVWFPATTDKVNNHFGWPVKFDPRTQMFTEVDMPPNAVTQFMSIGPDGKIWAGFGVFFRIDPKAAKVDYSIDWTKAPNLAGGRHSGYEVAVNSKGNPYITDFGSHGIAGVDVKTNTVKFWPTPTPESNPRRGKIDAQDRYWFAEFSGDKIAMFDTKTEKIQEWPAPFKYAAPYTASLPDKKGRVYAPSSTADRLLRLDPKTGEMIGYLIPVRDFDVKTVCIDPVNRQAVWMANVRNARLIKVEPLD